MKRYSFILVFIFMFSFVFAQKSNYIGVYHTVGIFYSSDIGLVPYFIPEGAYLGKRIGKERNLIFEVGLFNYQVSDGDENFVAYNYDGLVGNLALNYEHYFGDKIFVRPSIGVYTGDLGDIRMVKLGEQVEQAPVVNVNFVGNNFVFAPTLGFKVGVGAPNNIRALLKFNVWYDIPVKSLNYTSIYGSGSFKLSGFNYTSSIALELPLISGFSEPVDYDNLYFSMDFGVVRSFIKYLPEGSNYSDEPSISFYKGFTAGLEFANHFGLQLNFGSFKFAPRGFSYDLYRFISFYPGVDIYTSSANATYTINSNTGKWSIRLIAGINLHFAGKIPNSASVTLWAEGYYKSVNNLIITPNLGLRAEIKLWKNIYLFYEIGSSVGLKDELVIAEYTDNYGKAILPYNGNFQSLKSGIMIKLTSNKRKIKRELD